MDLLEKAIYFSRKGLEADEQNKHAEAFQNYVMSIEFFFESIKHENNAIYKEKIKKRIADLLERGEQLHNHPSIQRLLSPLLPQMDAQSSENRRSTSEWLECRNKKKKRVNGLTSHNIPIFRFQMRMKANRNSPSRVSN